MNNTSSVVISEAGANIVSEYINRKRLYKIGIVDSVKNISAFKAECLNIVSTEFDNLEYEETKRKMRK